MSKFLSAVDWFSLLLVLTVAVSCARDSYPTALVAVGALAAYEHRRYRTHLEYMKTAGVEETLKGLSEKVSRLSNKVFGGG